MTDEQIESLWQDINNEFCRSGYNRDTPVLVQFARSLLSASKPDVARGERTAFEEWISDADIGDLSFGRDGECYVDWDTQVAWRGWKGAIAASHYVPAQSCDMGVGCNEAGICYAMAHGQPDRCGAAPAQSSVTLLSEYERGWDDGHIAGRADAAPQPAQTAQSASDCPHAAPFRYCQECPVTPCPIGLGEK